MENNFENMRLDEEKVKEDEGQIMKNKLFLPPGMFPLKTQVAGHRMNLEKKSFGIIRESEEIILKSGSKKYLEDREIEFYEKVEKSDESLYKMLSKLIPRYCGIRELCLLNNPVKFLALGNITSGMSEPCVMDIKIGKRTWDPSAGIDKRASEEKKYFESKNAYGFSITGFQMFDVDTGCLRKFDKDYGKNLNSETVIEALKIFLNITPERPPCRDLLIMLLSSLWKILAFFRIQKILRFYSSSILIVYDARRLRQLLRNNEKNDFNKSYDKHLNIKTHFSLWRNYTDTKTDKKKLKKSSSTHNFGVFETDKLFMNKTKYLDFNGYNINDNLRGLCRTHSVENNYDFEMAKIKQDYRFVLNELTSPSTPEPDWVRATMIDFAHVYPAENNSVDKNYLDGIENLIAILEKFWENDKN